MEHLQLVRFLEARRLRRVVGHAKREAGSLPERLEEGDLLLALQRAGRGWLADHDQGNLAERPPCGGKYRDHHKQETGAFHGSTSVQKRSHFMSSQSDSMSRQPPHGMR